MMKNMIVASEPLAVEAGHKVLRQGGNAIDAALTCAFVQFIVNPQMCGAGGYALLTLRLAGKEECVIVDAPATAGSKVTPTMWAQRVIAPHPDGWGFFLKDKMNDLGYTSICTPGSIKAFDTILKRWGTWSWEQVIAPAMEIAEAGFMVDSLLGTRWQAPPAYPPYDCSLFDYITANPEARRIYTKEGQPYLAGEIIRNPDYARTLKHLAQHGADDFYHGELAQRMSADLEANGSYVIAKDFADYELRDEQPVTQTYRGYTIQTSQPPHGGPTLIEILNILEGWNLKSLGHNSAEYIYQVSMAMKAAFADRNGILGDPNFVEVPAPWLTSKERAAEWRAKIERGEALEAGFNPSGHPHTTHMNVIDAMGNCVSLTHSLGASSGVITPGLGFMYNNSMVNFYPLPDHPNSIAPRKGRTTGMSPTVVSKDGNPVLIIGAPGASRIITGVLQVIINILDFGMSVNEAVLAPRFDCQGDLIRCQLRIPEYVCAAVRQRHPIMRLPQGHGAFGFVHAIYRDEQTGKLSGCADTGTNGMALGV